MANCPFQCSYAGVTIPWLLKEIEERSRLDPEEVLRKFKAAQKIQALIRGFLVRRRIARWHRSAIIIQKYWRAYMARRLYVKLRIIKYIMELLAHRDNAAIMIQKTWRGYYTRVAIHNQMEKTKFQKEILKELILCVRHKFKYAYSNKESTMPIYIKTSHVAKKLNIFLDALKFKKFNRTSLKRFQDNLNRIKRAEEYVVAHGRRVKIPYGMECEKQFHKMCEITHIVPSKFSINNPKF